MGMFGRAKKEPARGHLRVYADEQGTITGVEVLAPLEPEEVEPALHSAVASLEERRSASSKARLQAHLKAVRGKAGMVDRLRGRVAHREEAALEGVPNETFEGIAGPLTVRLDGRFGYRTLFVAAGTGVREAGGYLPRALEEACKACEARWEQVILGSDDEEGEEPAAPEGEGTV